MEESSKIELKHRMAQTIEDFKQSFYKEFKVSINTYFVEKITVVKSLTLMEIELIAEEYSSSKVNIMRIKSRQRAYTDIRHVLFRKCLDMGYRPTEIATYFDWDHASILHAGKKITNLLECGEATITNLFNLLTDVINKRIELKGVAQQDVVSQNNTQSTISAMLYPGIHQSLNDKLTPGTKKLALRGLDH